MLSAWTISVHFVTGTIINDPPFSGPTFSVSSLLYRTLNNLNYKDHTGCADTIIGEFGGPAADPPNSPINPHLKSLIILEVL